MAERPGQSNALESTRAKYGEAFRARAGRSDALLASLPPLSLRGRPSEQGARPRSDASDAVDVASHRHERLVSEVVDPRRVTTIDDDGVRVKMSPTGDPGSTWRAPGAEEGEAQAAARTREGGMMGVEDIITIDGAGNDAASKGVGTVTGVSRRRNGEEGVGTEEPLLDGRAGHGGRGGGYDAFDGSFVKKWSWNLLESARGVGVTITSRHVLVAALLTAAMTALGLVAALPSDGDDRYFPNAAVSTGTTAGDAEGASLSHDNSYKQTPLERWGERRRRAESGPDACRRATRLANIKPKESNRPDDVVAR